MARVPSLSKWHVAKCRALGSSEGEQQNGERAPTFTASRDRMISAKHLCSKCIGLCEYWRKKKTSERDLLGFAISVASCLGSCGSPKWNKRIRVSISVSIFIKRTGRAGALLRRTLEKPAEACERSACMPCSKTATRTSRAQLATKRKHSFL